MKTEELPIQARDNQQINVERRKEEKKRAGVRTASPALAIVAD
jgi:hypothetical protein